MASPFDKFRKKQKAMLAILGVLCMFGFIIGPMILDASDAGQGGGTDEVVSIFGEPITRIEFEGLLRDRQLAVNFLFFLRNQPLADMQQSLGMVLPIDRDTTARHWPLRRTRWGLSFLTTPSTSSSMTTTSCSAPGLRSINSFPNATAAVKYSSERCARN